MSSRELPALPNLEHLKNQARALLRQGLALDASATARFAAFGVTSDKPKLADALHIDVASEDPVEALTSAIKANSASLVRDILARHPSLKSRINEPLPNYGFDAPAMIAAVHKGNREIIDALLEAGA